MHYTRASGQDTGHILVSQLVDELHDIVRPDVDRSKIEARIYSVMALYEIRSRQSEPGHPDMIQKFKQYLAAKKLEGYAKSTLEGYELELQKFIEQVPYPAVEITADDIRLYLSQFERLKPSSIAKKLFALRSFFGWLKNEEIIHQNPTERIKQPKQEQRMPKALNIAELELLREHCKTSRERALLEVLYATGTRLEEIQQVDRASIDWSDMSFPVIGKGDRERLVYMSIRAVYHLGKYLKSRSDDCPALFVTERKPIRRLGMRQIQKDIKHIGTRAGIGEKVHPHVLRHTFATLLLENGAELSEVQHLLGHTSPVTTQGYTNVTEQKKKNAHKKYLIQ